MLVNPRDPPLLLLFLPPCNARALAILLERANVAGVQGMMGDVWQQKSKLPVAINSCYRAKRHGGSGARDGWHTAVAAAVDYSCSARSGDNSWLQAGSMYIWYAPFPPLLCRGREQGKRLDGWCGVDTTTSGTLSILCPKDGGRRRGVGWETHRKNILNTQICLKITCIITGRFLP